MDVRAAIRRTRLPFVASLLLSMLLGAPAAITAPAAEPAPVSVASATTSVAAADDATPVPADQPTAAEPIEAQVIATPATPALSDQTLRAARTPRAPPRR